eukprot:CAMPEP_0170192768 /NCGR_PEP_ID=MMETSP0040_2-20121228/55156_1 /TAXON_ID=641309 /ORGANISM="Lotharella oceanica, Strain CCMP622" /LENGTH=264 /DNA_ID=CAMNT_0010441217 /DNA_START=51 /DNA_END=841 /DNA_ORIENTATION=+
MALWVARSDDDDGKGETQSDQILNGRDIRELVFSYLTAEDIGIVARVSKAWYSSSSSQRLWHGLYTREHGPAFPRGSQIVDWKAKFLEVNSAWAALIRSRRSITTFLGINSLAVLAFSLFVIMITFGLVANQHYSIYTYQPHPAELRTWAIDRTVEEDSDSDELVVTYRLRLDLHQQQRPISPGFYPLSKDASGTLEDQISLLRRIHSPSAEGARVACAAEATTSSETLGAAPHPWRKCCGGSPRANVTVYQPFRPTAGMEYES